MTVQYMSLPYEEYKELEQQMREFKETTHKSETGFYHKSIRLRINPNFIIEFHGPLVLAGQATLEPEQAMPKVEPWLPADCVNDPGGHDWLRAPSGGWVCQRCGIRKTGGV